MVAELALIFAVAVGGGLLPFVARGSGRVLHLFVAFATGVFLGVVFLHFLPEIAELSAAGTGPNLWLFVLVGLLGLYVLEVLLVRRAGADESERHRSVGHASFLGLCVHALAAGLGLGAASAQPDLAGPVFVSVASHKVPESFSLVTVLLLAGVRPRRAVALLVLFALVTPASALLGTWLATTLSGHAVPVLTALAAGTFLFVALGDLLPEVFHERVDAEKKIALLAGGVALGLVLDGLV